MPNYFDFNNSSNKKFICDNVVIYIYPRENIEFGLFGRHFFDKGQPSAYDFLVGGEIIYDKTGKYNELKKSIIKDIKLKRTRKK